MKNFERLSINSEKLLKNEELITLRGGAEEEPYCGGGPHCGVKSTGVVNDRLCCISEDLMIEMRDFWASDPGNEVWWCCENCETSSYCKVQD
jgi:hypothetical protein